MMKQRDVEPPRILTRFLRAFCPPQLLEGIEGDLTEQFEEDERTHGHRIARRRMFWNICKFMRPGIVLRNRISTKILNTMMIGSYLTVAARNIAKRKLYSFINAFGLSIGIAFCILIALFIRDELSFDQFHENKNDIYRVEARTFNFWRQDIPDDERWQRQAWLQMGFSKAVQDECPEVLHATRFSESSSVISYGDRVFSQPITYVDKGFFSMFSFPMTSGNPATVFNDKSEVVLASSVATKFFGTDDPIGKILSFSNEGDVRQYTVTGVVLDPPKNSSIDFGVLIPQENRPRYERQMSSWGNFNTAVFVQLRSDAKADDFVKKLQDVSNKYVEPTLVQWRKNDHLPADAKLIEYLASPLLSIHMMKEVSWNRVSDVQYSYILGGIAILILLIAAINYISLALTTSAGRRTEVGVRKVVGALRGQLFYQFTIESIILSLISLVVGTVLAVLFLPTFNSFTDKHIVLDAGVWQVLTLGLLLSLVVGFVAGSYPSLFLARFKPVDVLKGRFTTRLRAGFTRPLVVFQFAMAAFLIASSVIMYQQMRFISNKELGFIKNAVVVVNNYAEWGNGAENLYMNFRDQLANVPGVEAVAGGSQSFTDGYNVYGFKVKDVNHSAYVYAVDPGLIPALGIQLVHGRNFEPGSVADSSGVIVNEALMKDMGWTDLDHAYLNWRNDTTGLGSKVIGVVKDFHFLTLESKIEPMFFTEDRDQGGHLMATYVRVNATDLSGAVARIEEVFRRINPGKPFDYSFLDQNIAKQYGHYERRMNIMAVSTTFAILISCLGLFGLAGVNAINRTKEIGIRKVMGADVRSIFVLLNRQYVWLSLIAFAISIPFSWYVMDRWLAGFQFHVIITWQLFAISIGGGLLVALGTVSYHAIKASFINPADTLKHDS